MGGSAGGNGRVRPRRQPRCRFMRGCVESGSHCCAGNPDSEPIRAPWRMLSSGPRGVVVSTTTAASFRLLVLQPGRCGVVGGRDDAAGRGAVAVGLTSSLTSPPTGSINRRLSNGCRRRVWTSAWPRPSLTSPCKPTLSAARSKGALRWFVYSDSFAHRSGFDCIRIRSPGFTPGWLSRGCVAVAPFSPSS